MTKFRRALIGLVLATCVSAVMAPSALATFAAPTPIAPGRISAATTFNPRTAKTVITRLYVAKLSASTAQVTCTGARGVCPVGTVTTNQKADNPVTANYLKYFGAMHPVGAGAVVRITSELNDTENVTLTRIVVIRTRANAAPLIQYGCLLTVPGNIRSCATAAYTKTVTKGTAGAVRAAVQTWADAHPAAAFGAGATSGKLGQLTSIRMADAGFSGNVLATYKIDGQRTALTAYVQRAYDDTGKPPTAWKLTWLTRSVKPAALCRINEQPRELWFPALADPAICR